MYRNFFNCLTVEMSEGRLMMSQGGLCRDFSVSAKEALDSCFHLSEFWSDFSDQFEERLNEELRQKLFETRMDLRLLRTCLILEVEESSDSLMKEKAQNEPNFNYIPVGDMVNSPAWSNLQASF